MARFLSALTAVCMLSIPGCSTLGIKTFQKIPVTADPPGARVIVDGQDTGTAPLILVLKRNQGHLIQIEKEGYRRLIIRIEKRHSRSDLVDLGITAFWTLLGGLAGGWLVSSQGDPEPLDLLGGRILGGFIGLAASGIVVGRRETQYALTPTELRVSLEKAKDDGQTDVLVFDNQQMESVWWIRIKCADRPGNVAVPWPRLF